MMVLVMGTTRCSSTFDRDANEDEEAYYSRPDDDPPKPLECCLRTAIRSAIAVTIPAATTRAICVVVAPGGVALIS